MISRRGLFFGAVASIFVKPVVDLIAKANVFPKRMIVHEVGMYYCPYVPLKFEIETIRVVAQSRALKATWASELNDADQTT